MIVRSSRRWVLSTCRKLHLFLGAAGKVFGVGHVRLPLIPRAPGGLGVTVDRCQNYASFCL